MLALFLIQGIPSAIESTHTAGTHGCRSMAGESDRAPSYERAEREVVLVPDLDRHRGASLW